MTPSKIRLCIIGEGSSIHVQNRTQVFANRNYYDVTLVTTTPVKLTSVRTVLVKPLKIPLISTLLNLLQHIYVLRSIEADIFHIHFARRAGSWAMFIANIHPYIVSTMGGDVLFEERHISKYQQYLTKQVLDHADFITVKSNYIQNILKKYNPIEKMMRVVWGISQERFHPVDTHQLQQQLDLSENDIVLLSPKILSSFYNVHLVVEALSILLRKYPTAKLLITEYGADKDYRKQLQKQIKELGIDYAIRFVGSISNDEFARYYSLSHLVITVPSSDGFPQTVLEAMACETPNILGNLPNYREFLTHESNAFFVDLEPESIANGISHLIDDSQLYYTIVQNGKELVDEIGNIEREADRVEDVYRHLIQQFPNSTKQPIHYKAFLDILRFGLQRLLEKVWY